MFKLFIFILLFNSCLQLKSEIYKEDFSTKSKFIQSPNANKKCAIIIPGFGEEIDNLLKRYQLFHNLLKDSVSILFVEQKNSLYTKKENVDILKNEINKHLPKLKHYDVSLIGFSIGGLASVKLLLDSSFAKTFNFKSATVIDPPLDYIRLYKSLQWQEINSKNQIAKNESSFLIQKLNEDFFSTKEKSIEKFLLKSSVVSQKYPQSFQYNHIQNKRIMFFTNIDTIWQRQYRGRRPQDLNYNDCFLFEKKLSRNNKIELIISNPLNTDENPHSWNNIDYFKLISWIKLN